MTKQIDLNFSIRNTRDVVMSSSRPKKGANVAKVSTTNTLTLHTQTHTHLSFTVHVVWCGQVKYCLIWSKYKDLSSNQAPALHPPLPNLLIPPCQATCYLHALVYFLYFCWSNFARFSLAKGLTSNSSNTNTNTKTPRAHIHTHTQAGRRQWKQERITRAARQQGPNKYKI